MQFRALVVCVLVVGCAGSAKDVFKPYVEQTLAAHPLRAVDISPPATVAARPLTVGTWALYRHQDGFDRITVVAEDTRGTWVEFVTQSYDDRDEWLLCLRMTEKDPLQAAIRMRDGAPPELVDFSAGRRAQERTALAYLVSRVVPADWPALAYPATEDVDVPAGHFVHALRSDQADGTWWAHPAVPFDGLIRSHSGTGSDYVLVAYGDDAPWSIVSSFAVAIGRAMAPPPHSKLFLAVGTGGALVSGHAHESSSSATDTRFIYGYHVAKSIDLVATFSQLDNIDYTPDATLHQEALQYLLGIRWRTEYPLGELYVQPEAGFGSLERSSKIDNNSPVVTANGVAIGGAVGALLHEGHDWSLAVEASDHVLVLDSGSGTRNVFAVNVALQLDFPRSRWSF